MPNNLKIITICSNDVENILLTFKRGKACSFDGIRDNLFSLKKIAQIASVQIND